MTKYLQLISTSDRLPSALKMLSTATKYLLDWKLVAVLQGYNEEEKAIFADNWDINNSIVLHYPERLGMFNARLVGYKAILDDTTDECVINCVDDDMEFLETTNYANIINKILEKDVGIVSGNWAPHEGLLKHRRLEDKFVKQTIVYTGGGMLFSRKIAELLARGSGGDYICDNTETSLRVYTAGYQNFRYLGSLAIHRVCGKGGRKQWVNTGEQKQKSNPKLIVMKEGKSKDDPNAPNNNKILVGASEDVTPLAHKLHKQNRKLL